jgi:hypothetical protein
MLSLHCGCVRPFAWDLSFRVAACSCPSIDRFPCCSSWRCCWVWEGCRRAASVFAQARRPRWTSQTGATMSASRPRQRPCPRARPRRRRLRRLWLPRPHFSRLKPLHHPVAPRLPRTCTSIVRTVCCAWPQRRLRICRIPSARAMCLRRMWLRAEAPRGLPAPGWMPTVPVHPRSPRADRPGRRLPMRAVVSLVNLQPALRSGSRVSGCSLPRRRCVAGCGSSIDLS